MSECPTRMKFSVVPLDPHTRSLAELLRKSLPLPVACLPVGFRPALAVASSKTPPSLLR